MPLVETEPDALAHTYAQSLFELAESASKVEEIAEELEGVIELAREDATFNEFLASLVVPASKRDESLVKIFENQVSDLTLKFLRLLNRKERLGHLPAIAAAYDQRVQQAVGRVEVDVFTATRMSQEEKDRVGERISEKLGRQVALHDYVDPRMLGGIKIRVGDRLIDDSLATRLRRIKDRVAEDGGALLRARARQVIQDND
ncbi:MAG: ATP synthase F1 subunit delta [Planctomycetota bacterium]